jgi:DNA-binding transcriptional regulator YhcF (GntR family)
MEEELGKRLMPDELAEFLGVNVKTVREHFRELGGIRLGSRYIFFERRLIDAVSTGKWEMESPSEKEWKEEGKHIQVKEGCHSMGKQTAPVGRRMGRETRHNLLD